MERHETDDERQNEAGTGSPIDRNLTQWRSPTVRTLEFTGYTYFYQAAAQIKIGFSTRPERRLKQLQRAVKMPLKVLVVVPSDMAPEFETHQLFDGLRLRGEWFRADRELLYFIEGLKAELAERNAVELAPPPLSPSEAAVRDLHCRLHTMPKAARQFAYNLIDLFKNDVMARKPMGDHPLQRPEVLFRRQVVALERAMQSAQ